MRHFQNIEVGAATHTGRVRSANEDDFLIESSVNVASFNTMDVKLRSKPGGRLTVSVLGEDNTAPTAQWFAPQVNEIFIGTNIVAQVHLTDDISGLNPQSLQILLNGANVTTSFAPCEPPGSRYRAARRRER